MAAHNILSVPDQLWHQLCALLYFGTKFQVFRFRINIEVICLVLCPLCPVERKSCRSFTSFLERSCSQCSNDKRSGDPIVERQSQVFLQLYTTKLVLEKYVYEIYFVVAEFLPNNSISMQRKRGLTPNVSWNDTYELQVIHASIANR